MIPLVLVDFSNYVHTCWWPALSAYKADPKYDPREVLKTNLMGKLRTVRRAVEETYADMAIWFVEDRKSAFKLDIFPLYKANREHGEEEFPMYSIISDAKEYLKSEGYVEFCYSPDNEADDAIASIAHNHSGPVIVATSDKDLWQIIGPNVEVYHLTKDCFVNTEMIEKAFKVTHPWHIPLVKALWGDTGDNVPNAVPRMQKQLLPYVQNSNGTLDSFYHTLNTLAGGCLKEPGARARELLAAGYEQVDINYQLVKLREDCIVIFERPLAIP